MMVDRLLQLYGLMLRLYPTRFYQTFGREMAEVFAEKATPLLIVDPVGKFFPFFHFQLNLACHSACICGHSALLAAV